MFVTTKLHSRCPPNIYGFHTLDGTWLHQTLTEGLNVHTADGPVILFEVFPEEHVPLTRFHQTRTGASQGPHRVLKGASLAQFIDNWLLLWLTQGCSLSFSSSEPMWANETSMRKRMMRTFVSSHWQQFLWNTHQRHSLCFLFREQLPAARWCNIRATSRGPISMRRWTPYLWTTTGWSNITQQLCITCYKICSFLVLPSVQCCFGHRMLSWTGPWSWGLRHWA